MNDAARKALKDALANAEDDLYRLGLQQFRSVRAYADEAEIKSLDEAIEARRLTVDELKAALAEKE